MIVARVAQQTADTGVEPAAFLVLRIVCLHGPEGSAGPGAGPGHHFRIECGPLRCLQSRCGLYCSL